MVNDTCITSDSNPSDCDSDEYMFVPVKERVRVYDKGRCVGGERLFPSQHVPPPFLEHAAVSRQDPKVVAASVPSSLAGPSSSARCRLCNSSCSSCAVKCEDNRDLSACPVRIFVGTWNCVYQDVEEAVILKPNNKEQHLSQRIIRSVEILSQWLTHAFHRFGSEHIEGEGCDGSSSGGVSVKNNGCKYCASRNGTAATDGTKCVPEQCSVNTMADTESSETAIDELCRQCSRGFDVIQGESRKISDDISENKSQPSTNRRNKYMTVIPTIDMMSSPVEGTEQSQSKAVTGESNSIGEVISGNTSMCTANEGMSIRSSEQSYIVNRAISPVNCLKPPNQHMGPKYPASKDDVTLTIRQSTLQLKPLTPDDKEPLHDWIPPGYDVYIIALQETLSSSLFTSITKYLQKQSGDVFERVTLEEYKISGYGDGAFLHMKSTSIAVWVRKSLLDSGKTRIGKSKVIPLSLINRSKGVVTFQMYVLGQIIGVVGCHMPTRYNDREKAAAYIMKKLPEIYGGTGSSLEDVFHHILWTGDFNFRVSNISAENALALLNNNLRDKLFSYDEFNRGHASTFAVMNFVEGPVRFFPTYKKRDDRDIVDRSSTNWAEAEYHTRYETQWYKGRNVKERVPSWTDRVLKWSVPALHTCLRIDDDTYRAAQPTVKNILLTSDHSPVGCGLSIWPPRDVLTVGRGIKNLDTISH